MNTNKIETAAPVSNTQMLLVSARKKKWYQPIPMIHTLNSGHFATQGSLT